MKRFIILITVLMMSFSQLVWSNETAPKKKTDWKAFSENLCKALASSNTGLQMSAMRQIISYADSLNVNKAVFDVMRFYNDGRQDEKVRQMALMTLYKMQNKWAIGFLRRAVNFENSPKLKSQIYWIIEKSQS
ncbi:MAG: hypothetical protein JSW07_16445 [bacterium]|nr:MAG: hypothetical protein JSW07_16445 [bacterium]